MKEQIIWEDSNKYDMLGQYIKESGETTVFLVSGKSASHTNPAKNCLMLQDHLGIQVVQFSDFEPNPQYSCVERGVRLFRECGSNFIIAVGGGSAIDVAKCIKLYAYMDPEQNYLGQAVVPNDIRLVAIPTTAGTGSEATRYAVIYYNGEKQSITHESCIPSAVLMDHTALETLPLYQKKCTMLDAFCHALESFWSIHSNEESQGYSREVFRLILKYREGYLANTDEGNAGMLKASHLAGKAINITQTTAGHAMCYKLTSMFHIPHGYAAALCVGQLWPYMLRHMDECVDSRGSQYLRDMFKALADSLGCPDEEAATVFFRDFLESLELNRISTKDEEDYEVLSKSVNPVRLKNNPVRLSETAINDMYHGILGKGLLASK